MSTPPTNATSELLLSETTTHTIPAQASEIEREVIDLFDRFRVPLLRYVLSLGLSAHDGEEIVQEVFLALFRHLSAGKPRQNLPGWVFCVAHNLALKRRNNNQLSRNRAGEVEIAASQIDASPNPEEHALASQRRRRLLDVVAALPELDQCCLRLRAEGLRYREIARVLGVSLGGVSLSLTRSLARLMRADEA